MRRVAAYDFSKGALWPTVIRLAGPMIGAQLVNALYSVVDRIYLGQLPDFGRVALTGVGITFPLITLILAFANLCGIGGAPLCAIACGAGDYEKAEKILGNAFYMLLGLGALLTVVGLLIKEPLLYLLGASDETFSYANDYITIYLFGTVFVMVGLGMNPFINTQGFAKIGMLTMLIGAVANIALDPLFIFVFQMGVRGAAWATVISQTISSLWVWFFLRGKRTVLRLQFVRPEYAVMRRITGLGLSSFTMSVTDSTIQVANNASLQTYGGDIYVGVMTVIISVRQILTMPITGFSNATQPVLSFNYGAKQFSRVRQCFRIQLLGCTFFSFAAWGLMMGIPQILIRMFNGEPVLQEVGVPMMRLHAAVFFLMALQTSAQTTFLALGKAKQAIFFSLLRKAFLLLPLILLLPGIFGMGVKGVFLAEPISELIGPIACFTTFMLTTWKELQEKPAQLSRKLCIPAKRAIAGNRQEKQ